VPNVTAIDWKQADALALGNKQRRQELHGSVARAAFCVDDFAFPPLHVAGKTEVNNKIKQVRGG